MGIFKVIRHTDGGYEYLNNAVNYVLYGKASCDCVGSPNTSLEYPLEQMHYVKKYFDKTGGNPLFHFIISYNTRTAYDVERAKSISRSVADYFADRYQIIWCVHEKHMSKRYGAVSSLYHAHFIMNSVSYVDGRMFCGDYAEIYAFLDYIKSVTHDKSWKLVYGSDKDKVYEINENDV
mgnify:FL=1